MIEVFCNKCQTPYQGYEDNFYKTGKTKNGFKQPCKNCIRKKQNASNKLRRVRLMVEAGVSKYHDVNLKSITGKTADKYLLAISNWRRKYTWSEPGYGWMKSKERISMMQFKLLANSCKEPYTRFGDKPTKTI